VNGLPECPRDGHSQDADRIVVRDGYYGKKPRRRQRFRCRDRVTGVFHRFVPEVPRMVAGEVECVSCEHDLAVHEGPTTPRTYVFTSREVAQALIGVGSGLTYQEVSEAARGSAGRRLAVVPEPRNGQRARDYAPSGDLAANWVEVFAPVVAAKWAPAAWPEVLLVDATDFYRRRGGASYRAFYVFGAYGYRQGDERGQVWRLAVHPRNDADNWVEFFETLPGTPRVIVSDRTTVIENAIRRRWPNPDDRPELVWCVHHLAEKAREAFAVNGVRPPRDRKDAKDPLLELLDHAFETPTAWLQFAKAVRADDRLRNVQRWVGQNEARIRTQMGRRVDETTGEIRPGPESLGPLENTFQRFRAQLARRAQGLTNRERFNRMLLLFVLRLNGQADEEAYSKLIRTELTRLHGTPGQQLLIRDARGAPTI
jgi:hypothetical protein